MEGGPIHSVLPRRAPRPRSLTPPMYFLISRRDKEEKLDGRGLGALCVLIVGPRLYSAVELCYLGSSRPLAQRLKLTAENAEIAESRPLPLSFWFLHCENQKKGFCIYLFPRSRRGLWISAVFESVLGVTGTITMIVFFPNVNYQFCSSLQPSELLMPGAGSSGSYTLTIQDCPEPVIIPTQ